MAWVTSTEDKTDYGEKLENPSDHIPVCVQCSFARKDEIPVRSLNYAKHGLNDEDISGIVYRLTSSVACATICADDDAHDDGDVQEEEEE